MATADTVSRRNLHVKGLQRIYYDVLEVIEDIPHVALYEFINGSWTKLDIEGSAYITRNNTIPFYSFIIMNKKGENDLLLHIIPMIEKVKIQEQYLMLKCNNIDNNNDNNHHTEQQKSKILGVWIHDDDVRKNAKDSIDRILKANNRPDDLLQKFSNMKSYATVTGNSTNGVKVETSSSTASIAPSTASLPTTTSEPAKPAENKATQLLSFLKKASTETVSKESTTATVSSVAAPAPPVSSSAKLLSFLTKSPQPSSQPAAVTPVPPLSRTESGSTTPSPSAQKADQLLSLLSNASLNSRNTSPSGSDLLTDGDIAKAVKANQASQKQSPPSSATSTTTRSRGNSGSDLLAALIEPPKPPSSSKPPQPPVVAATISSTSAKLSTSSNLTTPKLPSVLRAPSPVVNGKPLLGTSGSTKKPVFLISPSDLED